MVVVIEVPFATVVVVVVALDLRLRTRTAVVFGLGDSGGGGAGRRSSESTSLSDEDTEDMEVKMRQLQIRGDKSKLMDSARDRRGALARSAKPVSRNCHAPVRLIQIATIYLVISSIECQCSPISTHITPRRIDPSFPTLLLHIPFSGTNNLSSSKVPGSSHSALHLDIMSQLFQSRNRLGRNAIFEMYDSVRPRGVMRRDSESGGV